MKITKEYIKGFFDGEGCIAITKKKNNKYGGMVFITNTDFEILNKISEKLTELKIKNKLFKHKKLTGFGNKIKYDLYISGVWGCYQFFKKIGTNNLNKRKRFEYVFKNSIRLKWILRAKKLKPKIMELRRKGLTYSKIAKKLNITIDVAQDIGKRFFRCL